VTRFGFHLSISGGLLQAVEKARALGCRTMQIFTRSPRAWTEGKAIDPIVAASFRTTLKQHDILPLVVHMPYLPNLAAADADLYERSVTSLLAEMMRAQFLGASFLVLHPGHDGDTAKQAGACRVAEALDRACLAVPGPLVLLLENTAGQGTEIGSQFRDLAAILARVNHQGRIGVCLDTAHAWAAGYDLSTSAGVGRTLTTFQRCIGLDRLHVIHLNDAKAPLGSGVDRHDHIGQGLIGLDGLRHLINHRQLKDIPFIMETPKQDETDDWKNLQTVKQLILKR